MYFNYHYHYYYYYYFAKGVEFLRKCVELGIRCSYVLINAVSYVMRDVSNEEFCLLAKKRGGKKERTEIYVPFSGH